MKQNPNESYADWLKRVQLYEYGRALQQLAAGIPVEEIMIKMSERIANKAMHPIMNAATNKKSD